ncbi:MAG: hypothetical protein AAGF87_08405 [Bacteroidota bacterium]
MQVRILLLLFAFSMAISSMAQTLLKDINGPNDFGNDGSNPANWSALNDELFIFSAIDPATLANLAVSDGTEEGTLALGTVTAESNIIRLGDRAFFGGCDIFQGAESCFELYSSDGTPEGTGLFLAIGEDVFPGNVDNLVAGDSLFYFTAQTEDTGTEVWRSNGTVAGTFIVSDINPGFGSGYAGELAVIDDVAYFAGFTPESGSEPWRSDGTPEGTYMIVDLNEGSPSAFPAFFTASGGFVYFSALGTQSGTELRRTNGQPGNVQTFGEFTGSTDGSRPSELIDSDGRLYYVAQGDMDAAGFDLFVFDHTGEPLHLDLGPELPNIFPRALMPFGDGEVIFNADAGDGREMWRSDGTIAGTEQIIDLNPGDSSGVLGTGTVGGSFLAFGDSLVYFAGTDGINAQGEFVFELFVTDGTAEGTSLVNDQNPGPGGTNPGNFFAFDDRLYFAATDPEIDREPFYLSPGMISSTNEPIAGLSISKPPYPNPVATGESLQLELQLTESLPVSAQFYNHLGQAMFSPFDFGTLPDGSHTLYIPITDWHTGNYFLVLHSGLSRRVFQLMIE